MSTGGIHTGSEDDERTRRISLASEVVSSLPQNLVSPSVHRNDGMTNSVGVAANASKSNGNAWSGRPLCS